MSGDEIAVALAAILLGSAIKSISGMGSDANSGNVTVKLQIEDRIRIE